LPREFFPRVERERKILHEEFAAQHGAVGRRHVVHEKIRRAPARVAEFRGGLRDEGLGFQPASARPVSTGDPAGCATRAGARHL
jgi:hypothetical protein